MTGFEIQVINVLAVLKLYRSVSKPPHLNVIPSLALQKSQVKGYMFDCFFLGGGEFTLTTHRDNPFLAGQIHALDNRDPL